MTSLLRIYAVFTKELRQLRRDRMTFGMVVMIPFIQLMLFGYAINTNIRNIPAGLVDQCRSSLSRQLVQTVAATQVLKFTAEYPDVKQAEAAIASAEVRAALVMPSDLAARLARHPAAGLPSAEARSSRPLAQWLVDGADPVIAGAVKGLRSMPLPELLRKPARLSTPTFGKIAPYMFIGAVQVTIILGLGHLIFKVPINGSLLQLAGATLLFIAASLTLGLVISTIAKNQLQSMQMTIFVLLPSILLSGFMFPYEGMPLPAQRIAEILPATHFIRLIRGVVLRDVQLLNMPYDIAFFACFIVVGLTAASLRFKKRLD